MVDNSENMDVINQFIKRKNISSLRDENLVFEFEGSVFFDKNNTQLHNERICIKRESNRYIVSIDLDGLESEEFPDSFWSDKQAFEITENDSLVITGQTPSHSRIGSYRVMIVC